MSSRSSRSKQTSTKSTTETPSKLRVGSIVCLARILPQYFQPRPVEHQSPLEDAVPTILFRDEYWKLLARQLNLIQFNSIQFNSIQSPKPTVTYRAFQQTRYLTPFFALLYQRKYRVEGS